MFISYIYKLKCKYYMKLYELADFSILSDKAESQFKYAIYNNRLDIVKDLIENKKIDPRYDKNYAFRHACKNGYLEMVKYFLTPTYHINVSDDNNFALRHAILNNHTEIVDILLMISDDRLDLNYNIIKWSISHNKYFEQIYKAASEKIHKYNMAGRIMELACLDNKTNPNIINLLLNDIVIKQHYFYYACRGGNIETVKILLQDGRFDPSDSANCAFKTCCDILVNKNYKDNKTKNVMKYKTIANLIVSDKRFINNNLSDIELNIIMEIRSEKLKRLFKGL